MTTESLADADSPSPNAVPAAPVAPPAVAAAAALPPPAVDPVAAASARAVPPPVASTGAPAQPGWLVPVLLALGVASGGGLWLAWQDQKHSRSLEQELVRRQQDSGAQVAEAKVLAKSAQDVARDADAKVAVLETRLSEVALQRTQLEELMQSLSRARDENLVTDIDAAIRVSLQQVAITGSAEPLVAALRSAEERLSRVSANQPRLDGVRRAIARDLDRVRSVGVVDMGALLIKLDECIRLIDELPLVAGSAAKPVAAAPAGGAPSAASAPAPALGAIGRWWGESVGLFEVIWNEVRSLVRVTRIDQPEAMLVAPDQAYLLRENMKLRLLNARLALLSRQTESAQGDLQNALSAMTRYFDANSRRTQVAVELLKQVASQARQTNLPRPDETLTALTAAAAGR